MEDTPVFRRPWFYIAGWLFFLVAFYGWQVYRLWDEQTELLNVLFELVCLFPLLLLIWVAFFSQFVLPVQTFEQRQKIFDRLLSYLSGFHGPALFIKNGVITEHAGERLKKGPGVVWLDSASAALTRTSTRIKQTLGPGVHFLANGEYITATLDLHLQSQSLGPREKDDPFAPPGDEIGPEYQNMLDRRRQVSAWTRDGIEVIPNISITFRVDTGMPEPGKPGSRFGYRTGITKADQENQKQDLEAIKKALLGEGINPNISTDSPLHKVAWNQLPAQLAVDVWREYAAKFTLDEFFAPTQDVPPPPPTPPQPTSSEIALLNDPTQFTAHQNRLEEALTAMLREINRLMERIIQWLDGQKQVEPPKPPATSAPAPVTPIATDVQKKTALQVINELVTARLTKAEVPVLDKNGKRLVEYRSSREFTLLKDRGLKVISISVNNPRLHPTINQAMIDNWKASWFNTVEEERRQIESRRAVRTTAGNDLALQKYAEKLSAEVVRKQPKDYIETLKILVMRSRSITLEDEKLRKEMTEQQGVFEEIIKWIDPGIK